MKDNTIENAMCQDLKDAGVEDNIKPDDSDDEEMKEMTSAERKRHKSYLKIQEKTGKKIFGEDYVPPKIKYLPKKERIAKAQRDERYR